MTNASQPRTDSSNRTKISPLAKSYSDVGTSSVPSSAATSSASSGCPRPEKSMSFLRVVGLDHDVMLLPAFRRDRLRLGGVFLRCAGPTRSWLRERRLRPPRADG